MPYQTSRHMPKRWANRQNPLRPRHLIRLAHTEGAYVLRRATRVDSIAIRVRVFLAVCVGVLVFGVGVAGAQLNEMATFGSAGSAGGEFASPQGVAVDQASGDVYVVDAGNWRVEKFTASGSFVLAFGAGVDVTTGGDVCTAASGDTCGPGTSGSGAGEFQAPAFVAVDDSGGASAGDVYVADTGDDVVSKFDSSGNLIASWASGGQLNGSASFGSIDGIAVDASGDLLVINGGNVVYEFGQDGSAITNFATTRGMDPAGLAVNGSGDLFKVNGDGSVEELTSSGGDVGQVTQTSAAGIAIDPSSGDLFVNTATGIAEYAFDSSGNVIQPGGSPCAVQPNTGCAATDSFGSLTAGTGVAFDPSVTLAGSGGPGALYAADASADDVAVFVPPAPAAPSVLAGSEAASSVTSDSATIGASVNANGLDTHYYFEYVDDADYDSSAPDPYSAGTQIPAAPGTDIGSAFFVQSLTANLTGLAATTEYHFRVVATNSMGTTDGPDQTFTTATPLAPSVDSESSSNIAATTATLNAQVNPDYADTHYYFEYVDAADYNPAATDPYSAGTQIPAAPGTDIGSVFGDQTVTANLTNLQPGVTYHYRVVAANTIGTTDGTDQTLTTYPVVTGPAQDIQGTTVTLTGVVNPQGADATYYFEYGPDTNYGTQIPITPADAGSGNSPVAVSIQLTNLDPSVTYHYALVATIGGTVTAGSDQTLVLPYIAPPDATTGSATSLGTTTATLSGSVDPEGSDATYHFEYGPTYAYGTTIPTTDADVGADTDTHQESASVSGLASDTTYHFRLVATGGGGVAYGDDQIFTTLPAKPSGETGAATGITSTSALVLGTVNPGGADVTYHFDFGTTSGYGDAAPSPDGDAGTGTLTETLGQELTGLTPATTYHYRLVVSNGGGTTDGPDETFTTLPAPNCAQSETCPQNPLSAGHLQVVSPSDVVNGRAALIIRCTGPTGAVCAGTATIRVVVSKVERQNGRRQTIHTVTAIGSAQFGLAVGGGTTVHIRLSAAGRKVLLRGSVEATVAIAPAIPGARKVTVKIRLV